MNNNIKYCFLFTIFVLLLISGIGAISAANTTDNQMIKNNEVKTVENNPYIVSTKNNEKTDKMNIEVKNKFKPDKKTTNITSKKEITKINKTNMKNEGNVIDSITSQNPSLADDK